MSKLKSNYYIEYTDTQVNDMKIGHVKSGGKELLRYRVRFSKYGALVHIYNNGVPEHDGYVIPKDPKMLVVDGAIIGLAFYKPIKSITELINRRLNNGK